MPFYAIRPGSPGPWRSLGAILRDRHEETRRAWAEDRAKREREGVPLSDDEDGEPPEDPGEYDGDAALDDVRLRLRGDVSRAAVVNATMQIQAYSDVTLEDPSGFAEAEAATRKIMADFICQAVAAVDGLEDEEGPFALDPVDEDAARCLDAAGLLPPVYRAAVTYMYLSGDERKNCGGSPLSTSAALTTTVPPAGSGNGALSAVMVARNNRGGPEPSTKPGPAQSASRSGTPGSGGSLKSTTTPEAN